MSTADVPSSVELVVADDGSIPAEQLAPLGLRAGAHLRVVSSAPSRRAGQLAGSLPDFPDVAWEDFERASDLVRNDLAST